MTWVVHSKWIERQLDGTDALDLDGSVGGSTIKLGIVTEDVIDPDSDSLYSELTPVATGTGWTGPVTLANLSCGLDESNNVVFDADDPAQVAMDAGGFANGRSLVIYDSNNGYILAHHTEASMFGNTTGPLDIQFNAGGIFEFQI